MYSDSASRLCKVYPGFVLFVTLGLFRPETFDVSYIRAVYVSETLRYWVCSALSRSMHHWAEMLVYESLRYWVYSALRRWMCRTEYILCFWDLEVLGFILPWDVGCASLSRDVRFVRPWDIGSIHRWDVGCIVQQRCYMFMRPWGIGSIPPWDVWGIAQQKC